MGLKRTIIFTKNQIITECGIRLAGAGYAAFGIDYEGHGRSMGARCYIKKFDNIIKDCNDFFKSISGMNYLSANYRLHICPLVLNPNVQTQLL